MTTAIVLGLVAFLTVGGAALVAHLVSLIPDRSPDFTGENIDEGDV